MLSSPIVAFAKGNGGGGLPEGSARHMLSKRQQADYAAIGTLQNGRHARHCTATLIAPDLVLTAAHCVSSRKLGRVAPAYRMIFRPGFRAGGRPDSVVGGAITVAEGYLADGNIGDDLALLRLRAPIDESRVKPIPVAQSSLLRDRPLSVFSFGYDAQWALAEESDCRALAPYRRAMVTSCEAVGGVSGAPVIARDEDGTMWVTAVVSSRLSRRDEEGVGGRAVVVPIDADRLGALVTLLYPREGG